MVRLNRSLVDDTRGVSAVEFAFCAPLLLLGMFGVFDLGHNMYTASIIQGAIQKAARDSTIEGASSNEAALDSRVRTMVQQIAPGADVEFTRTAYNSFSDVGKPEDWTDINSDGTCNDGEPFEDANGNGVWDAEQGRTGFGGARDAVLYEVNVTYTRVFPIAKILGQSQIFHTSARTVLRNQPYSAQNVPATENCT
ncbi:MAG: pilus assembly protein [Novosphingobium sp.]|nr:pilus assembly protein [Novosphingobium sp.]